MKKQEAINTFQEGMLMDFNPLTIPNNVTTNCLNGTILTFNGNEYVLQNDMGNGRVETAYLPEGYISMGTTSFGGIIYILSYNPNKDLCQIGCFPSPERNFTNDELNIDLGNIITNGDFVEESKEDGLVHIKTALKKLELSDLEFNPGDKFKIYFNQSLNNTVNNITDYGSTTHVIGDNPKKFKIHVVSINDSGVTYLDDGLKWFSIEGTTGGINELPIQKGNPGYFIAQYNEEIDKEGKINLDEYRTLVSGPYNIFKSKSKGKLALFFELETIDSFSYTKSIELIEENKYKITFNFNYQSSHPNIIKPSYIVFKHNNPFKKETKIPDYIEYANEYKIEVTLNENENENIWDYTLIPSMSFGLLDYLAINDSIDFTKIGKGEFNITSWKYYNNISQEGKMGSLLLTFDSDIYPKLNQKVDQIELRFIPLQENDTNNELQQIINNPKDIDQNLLKNHNVASYFIKNQNSYSGVFQINIPYESTIRNLEGIIHENNLYLVQILYHISEGNSSSIEKIYKYLWTCPIFNKVYTSKQVEDFTTLLLGNYLTLFPDVKVINNISTTSQQNEDVNPENKTYTTEYTMTLNGNLDLDISANLYNNYNDTIKVNDSEIENLKFLTSENEAKDTIELTEGNGINTDPIKYNNVGETSNLQYTNQLGTITMNIDSTQLVIDDIQNTLKKQARYIKESITSNVDSVLSPLITDIKSLNKLGINYDKDKNGKKQYYFPQMGAIVYTDESGNQSGFVLSLIELTEGKYKRISIPYGVPGFSDDSSTYIYGADQYNYNAGKVLSDLLTEEGTPIENPRIGLDSAITGIGNMIGTPIIAMAHSGYRKDDQKHDWTTFKLADGKEIGIKSRNYINSDGFVQPWDARDEGLYSIFVKTDRNKYVPIHQVGRITLWNKDENGNKIEEAALFNENQNLEPLVQYFMQLYALQPQSRQIEIEVVNGISYSNPFIAQLEVRIQFDLKVSNDSDISIKDINNSYIPLDDIQKFFKPEGLEDFNISIIQEIEKGGEMISVGITTSEIQTPIGYGVYLDDSLKINKILAERTQKIPTLIISNSGTKTLTQEIFKPNQLYYMDKDNSPKELDKEFNPVEGTINIINENDITFTPKENGNTLSDDNCSRYLKYQDNNIIFNIPASTKTMELALQDVAKHTGTIKGVPDIKIVKALNSSTLVSKQV